MLVFVIVFVACAIRFNWCYRRVPPRAGGNVRFYKQRLRRSWQIKSTPNSERSRRLLDHMESGNGLDTEPEEETLMDNNLIEMDRRQRHRDETHAFVKMLHSPSGSGIPRTEPIARRA